MDERNITGWALRLVIAVMEHEDTHGGGAACLGVALEGVPEKVRLMALGYRLATRDMNLAGEVRDGA